MLLQLNPQKPGHLAEIIKQTPQTLVYKHLLSQSVAIFSKPFQTRSFTQQSVLQKLSQRIRFFSSIKSHNQLMKGLLRYGKVIQVGRDKTVCMEKDEMDYFFVALHGHFSLTSHCKLGQLTHQQPEFNLLSTQNEYQNFFSDFKQFAPKYLNYLKKIGFRTAKPYHIRPLQFSKVQQRGQSTKSQQAPLQKKIKTWSQTLTLIDSQVMIVSEDIFEQFHQVKKHNLSLTTLGQQNYIFKIQFKKLCQLMRDEHNINIIRFMNIFLMFDSFKIFKTDRLKLFVQELQLQTYTKHHVLFQHGQLDHRIFVLLKGEVQLQRKVQFGRQNPNKLYKNRLSIQRGQYKTRFKQKIQAIPYSDFSQLYNSSLQQKAVKLSTLSPISIFGQQQSLQSLPRQVKATISSQKCQLFVFTLSQILAHFGADLQSVFVRLLEQQLTNKKILYRQQKLGHQVQILNKTINNGFYIQNQTSKKKNIRQSSHMLRIMSNSKQIKGQKEKFEISASYTAHNFQQWFQSLKPLENSLKKVQKAQQKVQKRVFSNGQKQILSYMHGTQRQLNPTIPQQTLPNNHQSINIQKPLFSIQYLNGKIRQQRRIEKVRQKARIQRLYSTTIGARIYRQKGISNVGKMTQFKKNLSFQL